MPSRPVPRTVGDRPEAGRPRPASSRDASGPGRKRFAPPLTVSHRELLTSGEDVAFRRSLYLMVLAFSRLQTCREAFGRALGFTGSQFAVLIGTAYQQHDHGVSVRMLADHIQLASTHVTTEVGRLIAKGLLVKSVNPQDRRGVLVRLSPRGEAAVREVSAFVRRVNDLLFAGVSRRDFAEISAFLTRFAANSEEALDEIRRTERRADHEIAPERPASARAGTKPRGR
jgi:MarR family transcriptional regulator, organic hydroperoxide resistance regulator